MKTKLFFLKSLPSFLMGLLVLCASAQLRAQKQISPLPDFKIIVSTIDKGLSLVCEAGCSWRELSFATQNYQPQLIDEYGITRSNRPASASDSPSPGFILTFVKTKKGLRLQGLKGTAWTDLRFSLMSQKKHAIDAYGTTVF